MSHLQTIQVFPALPKNLEFLARLSRNLWWCWNIEAIELYRRIDPLQWEQSGLNPVTFLSLIPQKRLEELSKDESFLAHISSVQEIFESELFQPQPYTGTNRTEPQVIAYFSMEFGVHESLPLFAGGLGVLAGDYLKAASDVGLPLVGVGLLYRQGYFRQFLDQNGIQQEEYPETDLYYLPISRAKNPAGQEIEMTLTSPNGDIHVTVWKCEIGRITLYLLDTNRPENSPETRDITGRLYTGNSQLRLTQEILLGIGGMRALQAIGISPSICHLNEGHCAFVCLERLAQIMSAHNVDLPTAIEIVARSTVFTTHTSVAAGHDEFPPDLVRPYLVPLETPLATKVNQIISWGQPEGSGPNAPFSMFVLGLRMSQYCNGVSELHGRVARRMWSHVWPGWPRDEIPISHITNGIHIPTWISIENAHLFSRYLGPDWPQNCQNPEILKRIDNIYDEELWRTREMSRLRLVRTCRELMRKQYARRNAPKAMMQQAESVLDPEVLTIGFSRRFASYKRATLLLKDPQRLEAIINADARPVQFIFAGKAHPRDNEGKDIIKQLIEFARQLSVRHRIAFLENYDINISRHLVQGVDVWLNTPRRPLEACGTSGIKAAVNGVLNLSVLDGWWCEGYLPERGWAIGHGEEYADIAYQDAVESQALYNLLENDVIECFYDRKNNQMPERWIGMMKESIKMAMAQFCSTRMIRQYEEKLYRPAGQQYHALIANNAATAKDCVTQRRRLRSLWKHIHINTPARKIEGPFKVGESVEITSEITLGEITPQEVDVELYYGRVKDIDSVTSSQTEPMRVIQNLGSGNFLYSCILTCNIAGRFGFTVRVTPHGDNNYLKYTPGLISWA